MSLHIEIDPAKCMGSGNCVYWVPDVFDVADDMVAVVVGDPDAYVERVRVAAEHCPTAAITLIGETDRSGGQAGSAEHP